MRCSTTTVNTPLGQNGSWFSTHSLSWHFSATFTSKRICKIDRARWRTAKKNRRQDFWIKQPMTRTQTHNSVNNHFAILASDGLKQKNIFLKKAIYDWMSDCDCICILSLRSFPPHVSFMPFPLLSRKKTKQNKSKQTKKQTKNNVIAGYCIMGSLDAG